jgi:DNA-binding transcriptional MerR regulator
VNPPEQTGLPWDDDAASAETDDAASEEQGSEPTGDVASPVSAHVPRPVAPREYYSIGEACELTGLEAHVLRYWEQKFPELSPSKNRSGNRVYQRKEIRLILLVKRLLHDEKYTIDGARARLEQIRRGGALHEEGAAALDAETLHGLRADLHELAGILRGPAAD